MKRSDKEWGIRIVILMIGLTIAHLGVTLFLLTELGSGYHLLSNSERRSLYRSGKENAFLLG